MTREAGFITYLAVTALIGVSAGLLVRRQRWAPTALAAIAVLTLLCAMWLTWVVVAMDRVNRTEHPAHIPLPGPSLPTAASVTLFALTGLALPGVLISAPALPANGRLRRTLKLACVLIGIYSPWAAFWAIMLLAK